MPGRFTTGPNGSLTPKPGTTLNGKGAPVSQADQFDPRGNNQIPMGSSSKYGGHMTIQESRSTQELKKSRGSGTIIKFPLNREDMYPAHIVFHPYKIDTGLIDQSLASVFNTPLIADYAEGQSTESVNDEITSSENLDAFGGAGDPVKASNPEVVVEKRKATADRDRINKEIAENQSEMGSKLTDLRAYRDLTKPAIQLFFPPTLQYNDAVNYNSANLGAGGMTALAGLNSGQSIGSALSSGLTEGMESIFNPVCSAEEPAAAYPAGSLEDIRDAATFAAS